MTIKVKVKGGIADTNLPDGEYFIYAVKCDNLSSIDDHRKYYFAIRDILWDGGNRGYTKKEIHNILKLNVMSSLMEDNANFNNAAYNLSTKYLTEIGWKRYVDGVKQFAMDEFNIFL